VAPASVHRLLLLRRWNYVFAAKIDLTTGHSPCDGSDQSVFFVLYASRSKTGATVGKIIEGFSNSNDEPAQRMEQSCAGTFFGSSVTISSGDIRCLEAYFEVSP
jgi:hypothetical protein